jgi:zinc/manganese transport system permease protein
MLSHEFARNALLAGTAIALASGVVGYFLVLRAQVFAADALSHVAFTGALAAALASIDLRIGLFAGTVAIGLLFSKLGGRARADDVAIGVVFVWVLGLGALFLDLFKAGPNGSNGVIATRTLFGSIFSLTGSQTGVAVIVAAGILAGMAWIGRPLLFATTAGETAAARGVRVGLLGAAFLVLLGLEAGEATQAVGALLLLGLLSAPAGAALRLTASPGAGVSLSAAFALASVWAGTTIAYVWSSLPPSSAILCVAVAIYAVAILATARPLRAALHTRR